MQKIRYKMLSVIWVFPSIGALWILFNGWHGSGSHQFALSKVKFEEWVAVGLLLTHAVWIVLAIRSAKRERVTDTRTQRG